MMYRSALLAPSMLGLCIYATGVVAAPYRIADTFPVGGDGKWDYPSVDSGAHRLYLSRATHVAVIDTVTGKVVGDIPDTQGVHGIAVAPDLGRGYISAGKADRVIIFDLKSLSVIGSVAVGSKPDAILYDPHSHQVFAFNGHSDNASVIDTATNTVVSTIALGGAPEFSRSDGAGHVYVNLESTNELAALDADSRKVTAHWKLPGCKGPTGLALDIANHRSFSVCANAAMTILDTTSGRTVATLPIGTDVDGAEFDAMGNNAFSANGDGTLTVVHENDPEHFAISQTLASAAGARSIALDPATHRLYLPTAKFGPAPAKSGDGESKAPILPGSFFVLVAEPSAGN